MSLLFFEGAAGTGKTTQLLASARHHLRDHPLSEGQGVLALTKFHGSRKRMDAKLNGADGLRTPVTCTTIDGFAWMLVRRWRALVRHFGLVPARGDFQGITAAAGRLLSCGVGPWVARSFPFVLVDEMQDCKGGDVELLAGLEPYVQCMAGADAFQDLSGEAENEALAWATRVGTSTSLTTVHRTRQGGLLAAAHALRAGMPVISNRQAGFEILSSPKAPMGGAITNWRIKSWSRYGQIAVITPTTRARSPFVDQLTTWVRTTAAKTRKSTDTAGPYLLPWEDSDGEVCERLRTAVGCPEIACEPVDCADLQERARAAGAREVEEWVRRKRFVNGCGAVTTDELRAEIAEVVRRRRAFATTRMQGRLALTVHQAKNREFACVVVLWPLRVRSDVEQQRRLLYNAITRARFHAVVIVEDPKKDRLATPLFAGSA